MIGALPAAHEVTALAPAVTEAASGVSGASVTILLSIERAVAGQTHLAPRWRSTEPACDAMQRREAASADAGACCKLSKVMRRAVSSAAVSAVPMRVTARFDGEHEFQLRQVH